MKAYRIKGWEKHYENNRSRELKRPEWLPLPNKFDGTGFMELLDHPAGMSHYGAWCLLLAAASRMPTRGLLVSDSGKPLTLKDLARMTRGSAKGFEEALPRLLAIGWVEEVDAEIVDNSGSNADSAASGADAEGRTDAEKSQPSAGFPQQGATMVRLNGKGNGNKNEKNPPPSPSSDSASEEKSQKTPAATAAAQLSVRIKSQNIGKIRDAVQTANLMGLIEAYGGNTARGDEWTREAGEYQLGTILAVLDWRAKHRQPIREPSGLRAGLAAWHEQPQDVRRQWIAELLVDLGLAPAQAHEGAA